MDGFGNNSDIITNIESKPFFKRVIMPWGDTDFYVLEDDILNNSEIIDLIDIVNKNAFNAPIGPKALGMGLKLKEGFKYKKSRKMLVKLLESKNIKTYNHFEMNEYCKKYNELEDDFAKSIHLGFGE